MGCLKYILAGRFFFLPAVSRTTKQFTAIMSLECPAAGRTPVGHFWQINQNNKANGKITFYYVLNQASKVMLVSQFSSQPQKETKSNQEIQIEMRAAQIIVLIYVSHCWDQMDWINWTWIYNNNNNNMIYSICGTLEQVRSMKAPPHNQIHHVNIKSTDTDRGSGSCW